MRIEDLIKIRNTIQQMFSDNPPFTGGITIVDINTVNSNVNRLRKTMTERNNRKLNTKLLYMEMKKCFKNKICKFYVIENKIKDLKLNYKLIYKFHKDNLISITLNIKLLRGFERIDLLDKLKESSFKINKQFTKHGVFHNFVINRNSHLYENLKKFSDFITVNPDGTLNVPSLFILNNMLGFKS